MLTVYHGTSRRFDKPTDFHDQRGMDFGPGFYFATSPVDAMTYGPWVYEADISLTNPIRLSHDEVDQALVATLAKALRISDNDLSFYDHPLVAIFAYFNTLVEMGEYKPAGLIKFLRKRGYDGIYVERDVIQSQSSTAEPHGDYAIVWEPDQIESWELLPEEQLRSTYKQKVDGLQANPGSPLVANMGYETDVSTELLNISCVFCGKALRVPVSIERGYGPDCDQNYMGGAGAAGVVAQMAAAFNYEEAEAAIRTAPDIEPTDWVEPTKLANEGDLLEGGEVAKGGEILASRPLRPGSLRYYWLKKGDAWKTDVGARQDMVSYGIWYASRAVTFGFSGSSVSAEKVDPRFLVVAAVQRFARAVGMHGAADRMANFYAARVMKMVKATAKERTNAIIFETDIPPSHKPSGRALGPGMMRIHAPYSEQYNRLARENRKLFVAFEKDPPYFWRYFHSDNIRHVVNICQSAFGDKPALTRKKTDAAERRREHQMKRIVDTWTGEIRLFPASIAKRLLTEQPKTRYKSQMRYQEV